MIIKNYVEAIGNSLCGGCRVVNTENENCFCNVTCMSSLRENKILIDLFSKMKKINKNPIFVDIGASNGFTYSNTFNLILNNWDGLSLECTEEKCYLLKKLYDNINGCRNIPKNILIYFKKLEPQYVPNSSLNINMSIPLFNKNFKNQDVINTISDNIMIDFNFKEEIKEEKIKYDIKNWETGVSKIFNPFKPEVYLRCKGEKITPDNILRILTFNHIPIKFEFLSLDIDSYDYDVLNELLEEYKPMIICAEIQIVVPPPIKFKLNFDENFWWKGGHFYGMSISMIYELCKKFNYQIVKLEYGNVFLIQGKAEEGLSPEIAWEEGYKNKPKNFQDGFWYNKNIDESIMKLKTNNEKLKFFQDLFKKEEKNSYELFI